MDGFDVRRFHPAQVYDAEPRLGRYLILAGYADAFQESVNERSQA